MCKRQGTAHVTEALAALPVLPGASPSKGKLFRPVEVIIQILNCDDSVTQAAALNLVCRVACASSCVSRYIHAAYG